MGDYKKLAVKYLKANRARSIITIIGVAITVMVLYGGLNFAYSYLLNAREETRQEKDYEFVLMTESKAQAEQIAADSQIEKAYIGKYEYTDWQVDEQTGSSTPVKTLYRNAVYATGDSPFHMEKTWTRSWTDMESRQSSTWIWRCFISRRGQRMDRCSWSLCG